MNHVAPGIRVSKDVTGMSFPKKLHFRKENRQLLITTNAVVNRTEIRIDIGLGAPETWEKSSFFSGSKN